MTNKFIQDMENDFLDDLTEDINVRNAVTKLVGEKGEEHDMADRTNGNYDVRFVSVPVSQIRERAFNGKILGEIEKLASSIADIGLLEPIIIFPEKLDDNKMYTISAGHRRTKAYKLLLERAKQSGDEQLIERFSKIPARILSKDEVANEEKVWSGSNLYRDVTVFEKILEHQPDINFFNDDENKKKYINLKYGEDGFEKYKKGELKVKFNNGDLYTYYTTLYFNHNPESEYNESTIKKYVQTILRSCDLLIEEVLSARISPRQARELSKYQEDKQIEIIETFLKEDNTKSIYEIIEELTSTQIDEEVEIQKTPIDIYQSVSKTLLKQLNFKETIESIKPNTEKFNGNQKEYYKQVKKILKAIETLKEMPTK